MSMGVWSRTWQAKQQCSFVQARAPTAVDCALLKQLFFVCWRFFRLPAFDSKYLNLSRHPQMPAGLPRQSGPTSSCILTTATHARIRWYMHCRWVLKPSRSGGPPLIEAAAHASVIASRNNSHRRYKARYRAHGHTCR